MADDSNDETLDLLSRAAQAGNSIATGNSANSQMQAAYDALLKNLQARYQDYSSLGPAGYKDIAAQQQGPSALDGIQNDAAARGAQQQSIASLSDLAANGGLSLADMKALNDIQGNLSRNNSARQKGLANNFAQRGQLGSGAQLAMGLQGQSDAAMQANSAGESTAAQAQARALQAILQKGQMARGMANDDYGRKADAARAADMIAARNAAARTDASKYNNTLAGQTYQDSLNKLKGQTALTGEINNAVFGKASQGANTTLGQGGFNNELIGQGANAIGKGLKGLKGSGSGGGGGSDPSNPDATGDRGGAADLGAGGDKGELDAEPGTNYGNSDPSEWEPYQG